MTSQPGTGSSQPETPTRHPGSSPEGHSGGYWLAKGCAYRDCARGCCCDVFHDFPPEPSAEVPEPALCACGDPSQPGSHMTGDCILRGAPAEVPAPEAPPALVPYRTLGVCPNGHAMMWLGHTWTHLSAPSRSCGGFVQPPVNVQRDTLPIGESWYEGWEAIAALSVRSAPEGDPDA